MVKRTLPSALFFRDTSKGGVATSVVKAETLASR
jgi:hypothetical protein